MSSRRRARRPLGSRLAPYLLLAPAAAFIGVVFIYSLVRLGWISVHTGPNGDELGPRVRVNQEHADDLWILRVCDTRADASYWEALIAAQYGLPTAVFGV